MAHILGVAPRSPARQAGIHSTGPHVHMVGISGFAPELKGLEPLRLLLSYTPMVSEQGFEPWYLRLQRSVLPD